MTMHIVPPSEPSPKEPSPKPAPAKQRTITLTNRAPIRIVEDEWPVIAEGGCGYEPEGAPFGWSIHIRVRKRKPPAERPTDPIGAFFSHVDHAFDHVFTHIVHANYSYSDERRDEDEGQTVRVGRVLTAHQAARDLWKHILETGEELRVRISDQKLKGHVIYAVDSCFADLDPEAVP